MRAKHGAITGAQFGMLQNELCCDRHDPKRAVVAIVAQSIDGTILSNPKGTTHLHKREKSARFSRTQELTRNFA